MVAETIGCRGKPVRLPFMKVNLGKEFYNLSIITPFSRGVNFFKGGIYMDKNQQLEERIKQVAKEGKISCAQARKVAVEFDVAPRKIGELCNQIEVKICACELGCF